MGGLAGSRGSGVNRVQGLSLLGVLAVHGGLLALLSRATPEVVPPQVLPVVQGVLVMLPASPAAAITPVPEVASPPRPPVVSRSRAVEKTAARPLAPVLPVAAADERAVLSSLPAGGSAATGGETGSVAASLAAAEPPPPAQVPVTPPRTDASHLNNPAPVYPPLSRRLGEQGHVLFDVYILPDGAVGEIRLKRSSGFARLDEAARLAVRQWRYVPARRGDEPIPYWYVQPVVFSLEG